MSTMYRLLGSKRSQLQDEKVTAAKASSNEKLKTRVAETAGSFQGSLQRPALAQQHHHNSENMVTLHAKLLQEADKIRKWKIQTELDLKEKEKKMTEALLRIETMKKSILELQLQNEKTSAKLEEELTNKGEILNRIDATREMCNLLKSHASSVIERLSRCETEKTELKYTNKEQTKQFQELTEKFKNLKIQVLENTKNSKNHADKEKLDQVQKENILTAKLQKSELQIKKFKDAVENKNSEIEALQTLLQSREFKIETLEQSTNELHKNISTLSKELEIKETELKDSALRIAKVQDHKSSLEKKLQVLEVDFNSLQASKDDLTLKMTETTTALESQLQLALEDAKQAKMNLEEELKKLSSCKTQLNEANNALESLKSAKDALMIEKKDAEINEDMLKFQISNLMAEKEENKGEIHNLNGEISVLHKKLDRELLCRVQAQEEHEALQQKIATLELIRSEKEDQIVLLKLDLSDLQTKAESMETILSKKDGEISELQAEKEMLEHSVNSERQRVMQMETQIKESEIALSEKSLVLQESKENLDSLSMDLKVSRADQEKLEQKLVASETEVTNLRKTLGDYEKKIEELSCQLNDVMEQQKESGKSLTTQQKKAATTTKLNKELEKELKALKLKLEKEEKAFQQQADEVQVVQSEMASLKKDKADCEASMQRCKEEMKILKVQCNADQTEARVAMEKAKEMQMNAEKEKENAQAITECQLAEMMTTLETYKQNNEKLISEKDSKLEELRNVIENQKTEALKHVEEKFEWVQLNDSLKSQVTSHRKEKEKLTNEVSALLSEKDELRRQVTNLENQISKTKIQAIYKPQENFTPQLKNASPPVVEVTPQKHEIPCITQPVTPKISTVPKTPSRSILRMVSSDNKRRKVAFAANNSRVSSSDESDVMEFDPEASVCKNTPLLFTPTSKLDDSLSNLYKSAPLNRKPRKSPILQSKEKDNPCLPVRGEIPVQSKPVPLHRKPRVSHTLEKNKNGLELETKSPHKRGDFNETGACSKSMPSEILNQSFESTVKQLESVKTPKIRTAPVKEVLGPWADDLTLESKKAESVKAANVRKTPARKKSKFFSESPRHKAKLKETMKDTSKIAWFDLDSVYGFGPED